MAFRHGSQRVSALPHYRSKGMKSFGQNGYVLAIFKKEFFVWNRKYGNPKTAAYKSV
jgi:hypothetical protein